MSVNFGEGLKTTILVKAKFIMKQPNPKKSKPLPLQTRLRILGHKLGVAEMHDWFGEPEKFKSMRNAHSHMLRQHYYRER